MAYFVFNPQTNELDSSDNPTPIRKNLGQQYLNKGGVARINYSNGTEVEGIELIEKLKFKKDNLGRPFISDYKEKLKLLEELQKNKYQKYLRFLK